jgi:hypothetical protein
MEGKTADGRMFYTGHPVSIHKVRAEARSVSDNPVGGGAVLCSGWPYILKPKAEVGTVRLCDSKLSISLFERLTLAK